MKTNQDLAKESAAKGAEIAAQYEKSFAAEVRKMRDYERSLKDIGHADEPANEGALR